MTEQIQQPQKEYFGNYELIWELPAKDIQSIDYILKDDARTVGIRISGSGDKRIVELENKGYNRTFHVLDCTVLTSLHENTKIRITNEDPSKIIQARQVLEEVLA